MKKLSILFIDFYKNFLSIVIKSIAGAPNVCRFEEHCDDYAKRMILEKGFLKGVFLGSVRLLKCQPFYNKTI